MFSEQIHELPQILAPFDPFWPASGKPDWSTLPAEFAEKIALTAANQPAAWPLLTADSYLDFTRNGNRARFEEAYMQRRRVLSSFAMAEIIHRDGKYLDQIINGTLLLCEETGWQLPAHNSYVRDTPCKPLPDPDRPVIDLFAAETGAQLALIWHFFAKDFDAVCPLIAKRIIDEIQKRIITPYLTEHFWWMGNGDEPMCNWTAWCTQNVLLAAFLTPQSEETRQTIVKKAAYSLDCFLKDYGEDGACEEGILYYRHAGLCLFNSLNILAQVAPDAFAPLWQNPKIRNVAEFVAHMHVAGDRFFNFADSAARAGHCDAREYLFGKAVGSTFLANFAQLNWLENPEKDLPEEINLFYRLQTATTLAALACDSATPTEQTVPAIPDHFHPSIGLMTARDSRFALAVKAGNNGESHNHNDTGSVTLYKDAKPFLIDVGVETYTAKTFSPQRYEIWTMQSTFHNLANFEDVQQMDGRAFKATDVETRLNKAEAAISMELSQAYPPEAELRSYRRRIFFKKGGNIELEDSFDGDKEATLSLMFASKPTLTKDKIILPDIGEISLSGAKGSTLETINIDDPRLRASWPDTLYRVLVPFASKTLRLSIA